MKKKHKFSPAMRVIGWIFTVWMGSVFLCLSVGGIYELTINSPDAGMILLGAVVFLGATGVFGWIATARNEGQSPEQ